MEEGEPGVGSGRSKKWESRVILGWVCVGAGETHWVVVIVRMEPRTILRGLFQFIGDGRKERKFDFNRALRICDETSFGSVPPRTHQAALGPSYRQTPSLGSR